MLYAENAALKLVTDAAAEPLELTEVKLHLNHSRTDEDELLKVYRKAARRQAEIFLGQRLITQTWDLYLDRFPCEYVIEVPYNLQSVTSISYIDIAGTTQTLASNKYIVDAVSSRITPAINTWWPSTQCLRVNAVTIRHKAGYGDAADSVPADIKAALLIMIADFYANREDEVIGEGLTVNRLDRTAERLLTPYRDWRVIA